MKWRCPSVPNRSGVPRVESQKGGSCVCLPLEWDGSKLGSKGGREFPKLIHITSESKLSAIISTLCRGF